jgi:hypothetical protein
MEFQDFKTEIIKRAKEQSACQDEFKRACNSESFPELFKVITDNFNWACSHNIIDVDLLTAVKAEANKSNIRCNENTQSGYLLVNNATVKAWGNATVEAWGNATVKAWGNATVEAWGNATVEAWGNATVKAEGNAFISSYKNIECKLSEHAIFRNTETKEITIVKGSYTIIER